MCVGGGGAPFVGFGVQCRWKLTGFELRLGSGLGLGLGLGELEEKWRKKNEENTTKGEKFFIRFKIDKTKKYN